MSFSSAVITEQINGNSQGLEKLKGKTIVDIGFIYEEHQDGLVIDYKDGNKTKRIVLSYANEGMWTAWHGIKGKDNPEDILKNKIKKAKKICDSDYGKTDLVDDPLNRCFRFKTSKNKDLLKLTISDLKILPVALRDFFKVRKEERIKLFPEDVIKNFSKYHTRGWSINNKIADKLFSSLAIWAY